MTIHSPVTNELEKVSHLLFYYQCHAEVRSKNRNLTKKSQLHTLRWFQDLNLSLWFHINYYFFLSPCPSEALYAVLRHLRKNLKLFSSFNEKEAFFIELCLD